MFTVSYYGSFDKPIFLMVRYLPFQRGNMTKQQENLDRVRLLKLLVDDSFKRTKGSINSHYRRQQAQKRDEWQREIDNIKVKEKI